MRRRKKKGADKQLLSYIEYVARTPEQNHGVWASEWFENDKPIHLELGAGRASFSIAHAQKYPDINYVAIDFKEEVLLPGVKISDELHLDNMAFAWMDIRNINKVFANDEVNRIYLNFSDPWPKNRHVKRRLTHRGFLALYKTILKDDGWIHFKTDSESLFEFTLNECAELGLDMKDIYLDLHERVPSEDIIMTDYEKKYVANGKKIFSMVFSLKNLDVSGIDTPEKFGIK